MELVGRNISNDVCGESNKSPPHIPIPEPSLEEKKDGKAKYLSQQVFGIMVNGNDFFQLVK